MSLSWHISEGSRSLVFQMMLLLLLGLSGVVGASRSFGVSLKGVRLHRGVERSVFVRVLRLYIIVDLQLSNC